MSQIYFILKINAKNLVFFVLFFRIRSNLLKLNI